MSAEQLHSEALAKELEGMSWRILPIDAPVSDKHRANLSLIRIGSNVVAGYEYAYGLISDDSRHLFPDGTEVRTSYIVDKYEIDGVKYIETRNTLYKLI